MELQIAHVVHKVSQDHPTEVEQTKVALQAELARWEEEETKKKKQWETELQASPDVNEKLGECMFIFFQMSFDICTQQFQSTEYIWYYLHN